MPIPGNHIVLRHGAEPDVYGVVDGDPNEVVVHGIVEFMEAELKQIRQPAERLRIFQPKEEGP